MRRKNIVPVVCAVVLLVSVYGCSALVTNPRAVSIQDIIYLSKHQLGADVIITHIESTGSRFALTTEDIVRLKEAGVDEDVIEYMVELSAPQKPFEIDPRYRAYGQFPDQYYISPPPAVYDLYHYPLFESYTGYYRSPYSIYTPPYRRQSGLIGRFYEYREPTPILREVEHRRTDGDDENDADGEQPERRTGE